MNPWWLQRRTAVTVKLIQLKPAATPSLANRYIAASFSTQWGCWTRPSIFVFPFTGWRSHTVFPWRTMFLHKNVGCYMKPIQSSVMKTNVHPRRSSPHKSPELLRRLDRLNRQHLCTFQLTPLIRPRPFMKSALRPASLLITPVEASREVSSM